MTNSGYPCLSTGNAEMDAILHGGFPLNSINIIMGQPGTGKTVFAEQMVFNHARENDRPILYMTTLSEPLAKVLTYLQRFSFYDGEKIGTTVHYQDIGAELAKRGISALQDKIREVIHTLSPKMIVIDSFKALHDLSASPVEMRRMLHDLTGLLTAYETTVFLVGEYTEDQAKVLPEFAIADGIVQFLRNPLSTRDERFVRVLKLRGSDYREGLHGFKVTSNGLDIFPRLITPQFPVTYSGQTDRVSTGIPGLDKLLTGGLLRGRTMLLAGPSGSGKTTASLQFVIDGVMKGEPGLYINFQENPTQLAQTIVNLGYDLEELRKRGLELMYVSPVELQIDSIIVTIFKMIQESNIKRLAIDSVGDLIIASGDINRIHDYIYSLNQHLCVNGVTSILTYELAGSITDHLNGDVERCSYMADSVIVLGLDTKSQVKRTLTILKQRSSGHELGVYELEIGAQGLAVAETPLH